MKASQWEQGKKRLASKMNKLEINKHVNLQFSDGNDKIII